MNSKELADKKTKLLKQATEITAALAAIEAAEERNRVAAEMEHQKICHKNIDALLEMVPTHRENGKCSDEAVENSWKTRCQRCLLLAQKSQSYWDNDVIVEIIVTNKSL